MSIPPPRFRIARPGYETAEVDAFLERVAEAMERLGGPSVREVRLVRFAVTDTQPGYDRGDVEEWLALLAAELERRPDALRPTPPGPRDQPATGPPPELEEYEPAWRDPGRQAVREVPATPAWVRLTAAVPVVALVGFFALSYLF